ncbi:MAG: type III secretion system cytoplasmic ring protein SctQ [Pseudomonadota bacterium]
MVVSTSDNNLLINSKEKNENVNSIQIVENKQLWQVYQPKAIVSEQLRWHNWLAREPKMQYSSSWGTWDFTFHSSFLESKKTGAAKEDCLLHDKEFIPEVLEHGWDLYQLSVDGLFLILAVPREAISLVQKILKVDEPGLELPRTLRQAAISAVVEQCFIDANKINPTTSAHRPFKLRVLSHEQLKNLEEFVGLHVNVNTSHGESVCAFLWPRGQANRVFHMLSGLTQPQPLAITKLIKNINVPVRWFLGFTQISLAQCQTLEVGDVLLLNKNSQQNSIVSISNQWQWNAKRNNSGVKIDGKISLLEEPFLSVILNTTPCWSRRPFLKKPNQTSVLSAKEKIFSAQRKYARSKNGDLPNTNSENHYDPLDLTEVEVMDQQHEENNVRESAQQTTETSFDWGNVPITMVFQLAQRALPLKQLSNLQEGDVLDLQCPSEHPIALMVQGQCVGQGEIVTLDGQLGVRITEWLNPTLPHA